MSNLCRVMFCVLLALVLGGCQTATRSKPAAEPALTTVSLPEPLVVAPPAPLPEPVLSTNNVSVPAAIPGAGRVWPSTWENVWVPLESWGKFNGFPKPVQLSAGPEPLYQLQSSNGLVLVKIGSTTLHFDGLQYGLGFAPRLIKGLPYIHSLDARKTFQVLVENLFHASFTNRTIVIDAGHGGRDSGALSSVGHESEKHFALDWAHRLARLLAAKGWKVVMTRTNDSELSLAERVAIAERVNADLFLSLHFNSGLPNRDLMGIETYCLTPTGMPSNLVREFEDDPREAHPNNAFDEQNVQLASRLHRSLVTATGAVDRGVRRARFMAVLRGQNRPAVLLEGGYLSNVGEARRIATPEYRQLLAEAVARVLD